MENKYTLCYIELARSDLRGIVDYVSNQLFARQAAMDLVDKLDKAISNLEKFLLSGHLYRNNHRLEDEYRVLVVENYLVFYVVYDNIVEIRRVLYGKRNFEELI
ncbi:type II toxin-antitoxin system RelE/ParE family toxin [Paenibacillus hexagrammi]|uniref:Type II toxin-antitoxin system RelE/ParE family toxin n=1 Tax=Paenibacillus hexagrammi TaxID=2908839 RepID=A0ABY3SI36_9BACL|nr:type II toxin-antitoxin system RelE/ParE family toxin [Paenibacillus sp. YPD9-1]UJF32622.1 type II toxin-antitoxin system RelE/ParE family toxin [Paenibacillus sp. YPD9-1]